MNDIRRLKFPEPEALHGKRVRQARRLEVDVEASVEVGCALPVDQPAAVPVHLELYLSPALRRTSGDPRTRGGPVLIEGNGVVDHSGEVVFHGGRVSDGTLVRPRA